MRGSRGGGVQKVSDLQFSHFLSSPHLPVINYLALSTKCQYVLNMIYIIVTLLQCACIVIYIKGYTMYGC